MTRVHKIAALLLLAGCAASPRPAEPVLQTQTVLVPVSATCVPKDLPPKPEIYPPTRNDLTNLPLDELVKTLWAGIQKRDERLAQVEPVIDNCRKVSGE